MTVNIYSPTNSYNHRLELGYDVSSTNTSVTIKYFGAESTTGRLNDVDTILPQTYVRYNNPEYIEASVKLGSTTLVNLPKSDIYTAIGTLNTEKTYTINKTHAAQSLTLTYYRKEYRQELAAIGAENTFTIDWAFTASGTISVPAKPSYSVAFNANGGSGAPSAQTKWYGETLTLSSTKPTRQFYQFDGWATSATGAAVYCTGTNNASNTSYTANATATLYAHWTRVHQPPTISSFTVSRCNANGDPDDEGTCCKAKVTWSVDTAVYSSNVGSTLSIGVSGVEGTKSVSLSGTGTTTEVVYDAAELGTDSSYRVTATVTDAQSKATSRTSVLSMAFFTMDFKEGGHGIGIGKPANDEVDNLLDIAMETRFNALATAQGTTSSSVEFGSTNPRFRFSNANASQNGELVFTDYDAVHTGATLAWITDQPQSWFHAQHIHATGSITSGGTVTAGQSENIKSTAINDASVATSSNTAITNRLDYAGNGTQVGYSQIMRASTGIYRSFAVTNPKTNKTTALYLNSNDDGTQSFSANAPLGASSGGTGRAMSTANRTYWCGRIIYDNNTGTTGTVSLSETAANFTFMFIGYRNENSHYSGIFVRSPNGKTVCLANSLYDGSTWGTRAGWCAISGTSITRTKNHLVWVSSSSYGTSENSAKIYITHVIGFA